MTMGSSRRLSGEPSPRIGELQEVKTDALLKSQDKQGSAYSCQRARAEPTPSTQPSNLRRDTPQCRTFLWQTRRAPTCHHAPHFKSPSTRDTHLTLPPRSKPAVTEEQTQRHCHDIQAHESPQHWRSQLTKYLLIVIDSGTEAEGSRLLRGLPGPGGLASTLGKGR